jgi:phosphopentomutase
MARALLLVLDSVGCGAAPDAAAFNDAGADTLGHIVAACASGLGDREGLRHGPLHVPHLDALGLRHILAAHAGTPIPKHPATALWGHAVERAPGKDTPSGHWELAGAPLLAPFGYFPEGSPCLPPALVADLITANDLPGILGDCHAAGPVIVAELGAAHVATGKPILYTSVDSVLQIAAHETHFGLQRLYDLCSSARHFCDPLNIGRVIARPFVGENGAFVRTANRRDFAMAPPPGNLLDRAQAAGRAIVSVGKIGDIFAHRATGREIKGADNDAHLDATRDALDTVPDGGLIFCNLLDFDTDHGHRRDVAGYAACLESFDRRLPEIETRLRPGDLAIITADHGNDPTFRGTDHTREVVPVLAFGPAFAARPIGARSTFADIGASLAAHLGLAAPTSGTSFL